MPENNSEIPQEESSNNEKDGTLNAGDRHERERADADRAVGADFSESVAKLNDKLYERPVFFEKGREFSIDSTEAYWVGECAVAAREADRLAEMAVEEGDYRREQVARKLAELLRSVADSRSRLVEIAMYHPEIYKSLADVIPGLQNDLISAQDSFQEWKKATL